MNNNEIRNQLNADDIKRWDAAIERNNVTQAAGILVDAGLCDYAIQYCEENNDQKLALEIAIQCKQFDTAEKLAQAHHNEQKLAEIFVLKGDNERAARLFTKMQQFAKAAKLYMTDKKFEEAGLLYAKVGQFMDAVMCYQKAGNVQKQLEMQIAAFDKEYAMANGDISAVTVSRTMAVYAAKIMLEKPETAEMALITLEKAQALEETAKEFCEKEQYDKAAACYSQAKIYNEARLCYIRANDLTNAIEMCKKLNSGNAEIETLMAFKQYFRLAQKLISVNQFEKALKVLKHIDNDDPNYSSGLELEGDLYCRLKQFSDAVLCYETLLWSKMADERTCRIAYKAGYSYEAIDDYENALKNYKVVYSLNPSFHDISNILQRVSDKIREKEQTSADNPQKLSDLGERVRIAPSKGIMRTTNSRSRVSTTRLGCVEMPAIGNDRYKIIEEIAHGGMGVVYKATDVILMRPVALKVLSNKLKDNEVALEYFMREARASAALQHINIVTTYDIGSFNDGNIYLAMEYIEGKNLKQLIQQTGAFPTKFLVQVAIHACRGLQYAHDNSIIHRDVKSSNMMLAKKDKTLKILDMGLAKMIGTEDKESTQAIGTPYYMSPEQILGSAIDCRSDIYSLGITLYECATGTLPFVKGDLPYKHVHEAPPPLSTFNPNINPQIEQIVLKMMEKKPDDRFSSCNECIAALKRVNVNV